MGCRARDAAGFATAGGRARAWRYEWSHAPAGPSGAFPALAHHASEIPFVFGVRRPRYGEADMYVAAEAEYGLAAALGRYWLNFAESGDPNAPRAPAVRWPAHDEAGRAAIELGADDVGCAAVGDFKGAKCDFWARHPEPVLPNRAG